MHLTYLERAAEVVLELQRRIDATENWATAPVPNLSWSENTLEVFIGDVTVWSDQHNESEELTADFCCKQFIEQVNEMVLLFQEKD